MASPNISFDQIPASIRKPGKYFEFNTKLAVRTLPGNPQRVLLIGQRLINGSQPALNPLDIFSDEQAAQAFGRGSNAHLMVRAAIAANPYLQLTAIAVDDPAGSAAAGSITFANAATSAGTISLNIAGTRVDLSVAAKDTPESLASQAIAAINKLADLQVSAAAGSTATVVNITARHKGTVGNSLVLKAFAQVAGMTVAVVAMKGGTLDPDIAPALKVAVSGGHHIVINPFSHDAAITALRNHLDFVSGPLEQRGAIGVMANNGSLAEATALAGKLASGRVTLAWYRGAATSPAEIAAAYAAVVASEEDPARPLNTLELKSLDVVAMADRSSRTEQESALYSGLTPLEVGPGERVQIVRALSTYTKDAQGVDDVSLLDITTIRTLDYVRKACRERIALRFPREKLSERTPAKVRSELLDVLYKLEELEIIEAVEANKEGLIVERDSQDVNRLDAKIPVDVVNGLHVFAGRIDLLL
ncbi:phage tail sheath subtilisin-like domain-containing protein [Neisseriaceae bacterium TC5R-5]|nr:phage tail sheath subtilisin-like domain-containing protein [Neisseriaceae bacterium TC5R-5]